MTSMRKPSTPLSSQKLHQVVDFVADLGVVPVEVGLLHGEVVQVVFLRRGIVSARRSRRRRMGSCWAGARLPLGPGLPGRQM